jgi:hypothetical protein
MKHLVFYTSKNTWLSKKGVFKRDGDEFKREAQKYKRYWESKGKMSVNNPNGHYVSLVDFGDSGRDWRRLRVTRRLTIRNDSHYDVIAFFCHGYSNGVQAGFKGEAEMRQLGILCNALSPSSVVFYACSMAKKLNGALAWFTKEMSPDTRVFGHRTAGHTSRNPYVVEHYNDRRIDYKKSVFNYRRGWKAWIKRLKTDFRFELPVWDPTTLESE